MEALLADPMMLSLALGAGVLVGFILGLVGGGGSILAVPLLLYGVGVETPHIAIGTAAVGVAVNAASGLAAHARAGTVKWPCALVFSGMGVLGAYAGSSLGKAIAGDTLLAAFGVAMVLIGIWTLVPRAGEDRPDVRLTRSSAGELLPRLMPFGFLAGGAAGFFGIGGGFLIAPGLMAATRMPLRIAVGTSLVALLAFGATTAANYAAASLVNWPVAGAMILGGFFGGVLGQRASSAAAAHHNMLAYLFAALVIGVGAFITWQAYP
ncbi:sulfite exporter TauE/SafE family protein [Pyruvatibacter mobilis]|uniref:sulfite exporter TauE/SafE family protein n=1 Tax=Pyruvatibacter mobilis TaxID=1712261 RepID=UPI003D1178C9